MRCNDCDVFKLALDRFPKFVPRDSSFEKYGHIIKLPHFERVHVVFELDGVSFYRVYFI